MPSVLSRIGILFSIPLLRRYNGRRGKKSKLIQWSFYWFYPFHLLIIYFYTISVSNYTSVIYSSNTGSSTSASLGEYLGDMATDIKSYFSSALNPL